MGIISYKENDVARKDFTQSFIDGEHYDEQSHIAWEQLLEKLTEFEKRYPECTVEFLQSSAGTDYDMFTRITAIVTYDE
jgi:hypothetical protein